MFRRKPKPHEHIFRIDFQHGVFGEDRFYCAVKYCNASYIKKYETRVQLPEYPKLHKHRLRFAWKTWSSVPSYDHLYYIFKCTICGELFSKSVRKLWDGFVHRI